MLNSDSPAHMPALVRCDSTAWNLRIAGVSVLDRLVVALHRGGCRPIRLQGLDSLPQLPRSQALGIVFEVTSSVETLSVRTLFSEGNVYVQAQDVASLVRSRGRLTTSNGERLNIGVLDLNAYPQASSLDSLPALPAARLCGTVIDPASAKRTERRLWATMGSDSDGIVDTYFNRPLGRGLTKLLLHTPVTPNQVTLASTFIGLVSAWFFADGRDFQVILGAILLQLSALVDCVDGELARIAFKESPIGKWLDIVLDQVVHVFVFAGIGVGIMRTSNDSTALWLGGSAIIGTLIAFPVVLRARKIAQAESSRVLQKLIDAASTRDFTVLILLLACLHRMEWFLWLTAIMVHLFWTLALWLQLPLRKAESLEKGRVAS